ncbi:hypothetical protein H072_5603 [Dactylellina haptotyla CBS 200.50]|uniref:Rab proteins geranylgeranyltransferase n=1 Tax=Dactylellina haptotyla (strain CBS 200.50) TaxID=1284197 RepID=S8BM54_DACHA|nr:hypothetical protein H072_5603 [Dactylellina haptotyla CBS 200.50]
MNIESLNQTIWDAVIVGTGLRESILAAALTRAGKRVLHLDRNPYYGSEYTALSLDELETWARLHQADFHLPDLQDPPMLAKPRSYTLSLSPGLLYTTSPLLSLLVASGIHESLEFLRVGGWFIYRPDTGADETLTPVPNSREDVFNDQSLDPRAKRLVVRALKSILGLEGGSVADWTQKSLQEYLEQSSLHLPSRIISAFASLTLRHDRPGEIPFEEAERDIRNHFGSIGRFGPGFAAVIGRYGSGSELVQVFCRAAAVTGNAVYVLESDIMNIENNIPYPSWAVEKQFKHEDSIGIHLQLRSGDSIWARHLIATADNLPGGIPIVESLPKPLVEDRYWLSVCIVSNPLQNLLRTSEPPLAAGAVVYIPANALKEDSYLNTHPIYIFVHGSETGECPDGQSILYVSMKGDNKRFLDTAVNSLLNKVRDNNGSTGQILLSMKFENTVESRPLKEANRDSSLHILGKHTPLIEIPDAVLDQVIDIYGDIVGSRDTFMEKVEVEEGEPRDNKDTIFE